MFTTLPPEWITTCSFSTQIEGSVYEFSLEVNLFGEVISIENYFLQLPAPARQLMAGNKTESVVSLLEKWSALLHYYVPLAALGYLDGEAWRPVNEPIKQLRETIPLEKMPDFAKVVRDEWVQKAYSAHATVHGKYLLNQLADLLLKEEEVSKYQALVKINGKEPKLIEPVLHALLPVQESHFIIERYYAAIAAFGTASGMEFLLAELKDKKSAAYHKAILSSLAGFEDLNLREQMLDPLLAYFHNIPNSLSEHDYAFLLRQLFGAFPYPKVEDFLFRILKGYRIEPALAAFDILRGFNKEERMIVQSLRYIFSDLKPPLEYIECALAVYRKTEQKQSLPYSKELLDLFVWCCREHLSSGILQRLIPVLKMKLEQRIYECLSPYLQHIDFNVQKGARLFFSKEAKMEFAELQRELKFEDPIKKKAALNNIRYLAMGYDAPQLIRPLLKMKETEPDLKEPIMLTLGPILERTPEKVALPALVAEIENGNPRVRQAVASSLEGYLKRHPEALSAIEQLWNDPDDSVRKEARRAYHKGLRTRRRINRVGRRKR